MQTNTRTTDTKPSFRKSGRRLFFLLLVLSASSLNAEAQNTQKPISLESGKMLGSETSGGQTQSYQINLTAGQFASVSVRQRGVDVIEKLFAPDGKLIAQFDDEVRPQEQERADFVAETAGFYRLDVEAKIKNTTGRYEIQLTEVRTGTEHDRAWQEARKLATQSSHLLVAGKYDEALPLAERALLIGEKELGPDHIYVAELAQLLGDIYSAKVTGPDPKAKALYERALAICEKELGRDHPRTASTMRALGAEYLDMGEYPKADQLLSQALEIEEKTLGLEHPQVARCLYSLGLLNMRRGESQKGEAYYQRSLTITEKTLGIEDKLYADLLNVLAQPSFEKHDYQGAEKLLQRAVTIYEKLFGPEHFALANPLQNLGNTISAEKDYTRAESYYLRVLAIREKFEGANNADIAWVLNNLGNLYRAKGDYSKAIVTLLRAVGILDKTVGPYPPVTLLTLGSLARNYAASGDSANAIKSQARVDQVVELNLALNLSAGSERQKLAFLSTVSWRTDRTISLNLQLAPNDKDAIALATLVLLQRKGRVLDTMADTRSALRQHASAEDRTHLDQLGETTAKLTKFALNGPQKMDAAEYQKQLKTLEEQREKFEAEISRSSAEFRAQSQTVTLDAVQKAIPDHAVLIEFATYRPFNPKAEGESELYGPTHYAAYIVRRQGVPTGQDLGTAKEIDEAVSSLRTSLRDPKKDVHDLARAVDEKVMRPVRALAGDATQLLVSPDGELNLIPFAALVDEHGHYLIERYAITYLTSGRDLLRMQVAREAKSKPLVVANPAFGEPPAISLATTEQATKSQEHNLQQRDTTVGRDLSQVYFAPLGGTAQEASTIQALFPDANLLTGAQATESALKEVTAPRILHIATHGFFLADAGITAGSDPQAATRGPRASNGIENPLLRSGLALAGANQHGGGAGDDGILTALEASGLNLWGTKLAVLSACDTGVGEVRNGEGVYGLRRAFVLAGTESLLMSLWPVTDYSTRRLMADYYKNLKEGKGRGAALREVQLDLLKTNPKLHPFYWANFIQSGEWANLDGAR